MKREWSFPGGARGRIRSRADSPTTRWNTPEPVSNEKSLSHSTLSLLWSYLRLGVEKWEMCTDLQLQEPKASLTCFFGSQQESGLLKAPLIEKGQLENQLLHHGSTCPIDGNAHVSMGPHYNKRTLLRAYVG